MLPVPLVPDGRTIRQDLSGPNRTPDTAIFIPVTNAIERLHEEFKRRIKTQCMLPCADTACMLFWALLASSQITLRKVAAGRPCMSPLSSKFLIWWHKPITSPLEMTAIGHFHQVNDATLLADQIALPYIDSKSSGQRQLRWKLPVYSTVDNLLTNPVYAGAYVFGRTGSRTMIENGRKRILRGYRKDRSDWAVLLVDHHEGYLSWADFERNQRLIADNANGKGMMVRGAVRKGEALLGGLLRCGHCGRRLLVSYNGTKGDIGRYYCDATRGNPGAAACISFGALRVDQAVGVEIVRLLQPLGVEAAVRAITDCEHQCGEKQRQLELALEQARYEAVRRGGNMMQSILTIALSLANSSGAGMSLSPRSTSWRRSWRH